MATKDHLTVTEMAKKIGVKRQAILKAIKEKRIKAEWVDSGPVAYYLIHKRELKKFK